MELCFYFPLVLAVKPLENLNSLRMLQGNGGNHGVHNLCGAQPAEEYHWPEQEEVQTKNDAETSILDTYKRKETALGKS